MKFDPRLVDGTWKLKKYPSSFLEDAPGGHPTRRTDRSLLEASGEVRHAGQSGDTPRPRELILVGVGSIRDATGRLIGARTARLTTLFSDYHSE